MLVVAFQSMRPYASAGRLSRISTVCPTCRKPRRAVCVVVYTIMVSRYFDAFRNFGGLCLVKKAYPVGENFTEGRATAFQTVEFIDSLIQCAINEPGYIWNIPDADIGQWSGRLTRASARALRAKVWMFAASPLFNNDKPYLTYDKKPTGFENEEHIWFGKKDPSLWNRCLKYCDEFFADNATNGNYYQLIQPATQDGRLPHSLPPCLPLS